MKQDLIEIERWLREDCDADPRSPQMRRLRAVIDAPEVDHGGAIELTATITAAGYVVADQHGRNLAVRAVQVVPDQAGRPVITITL